MLVIVYYLQRTIRQLQGVNLILLQGGQRLDGRRGVRAPNHGRERFHTCCAEGVSSSSDASLRSFIS